MVQGLEIRKRGCGAGSLRHGRAESTREVEDAGGGEQVI
jgi:hypothetical protein